MKTLFLSQYFAPEAFSNTQIAEELSDRGHEVTVVTGVPNYPEGRFFPGYSNTKRRRDGMGNIEIRRAWTIARGTSRLQLIANYLAYPVMAFMEISRLSPRNFDVSFVSMPSPLLQALAGILAKWRYRIPTVYWVQDLWPETVASMFGLKDGIALRILDRLCGWIYRKADIVLVQSAAMVPLLARHGVDGNRVRVLYNTAPLFYRPLAAEGNLLDGAGTEPMPFTVLFAGNIGEAQGLEVLVDAAADLSDRADVRFVLVGSGRGEQKLQRYIAEKGLQSMFHFLGRHPEEEMPHFFAHADALFLSLRDEPIFELTVPYKLQTYMACAKPILASLNGEGARIVEEAEAGLAAPAGDGRALADAILLLSEMSAEHRARIGTSAREYFERHFSRAAVFQVIETALSDAAGQAQ